MRESRLATDVGTGYGAISRGPGLFLIEATPSEGKNVLELEQGIRQEIARVQREGISTEELQRVKAQVVAAQVYQRDSMFYQAMLIGQMESAGLSWRDEKIMLERLNAVTAEQVQAVAQKYLQDDGLTIATLDPQPMEAKHAVKKMTGGRHAH